MRSKTPAEMHPSPTPAMLSLVIRRNSMRLALTASLAAGLATGCVNEDISLFVQGAQLIDPQEGCLVDPANDVFFSGARLDLLNPTSYTAALIVVTNLPATFNNQEVTQGQQQSPNFPDYGGVDNNVVIIDSAATKFSFVLGEDDAANVDGNVNCNAAGECALQDALTPASSTVFNTQTQLNSEAVVFAEVIPAATAQVLADNLAGVLEFPSQTVRVTANVQLKGTTTGNGALRELTTIAFPLQIDVCRGCLAPDAGFCDQFGANVVGVGGEDGPSACFAGQDFPLAACVCADDSIVTNANCEP
jgi:hypothetical protein